MSGLVMKYFVLKPRGTDAYAAASRAAMRVYAESIKDTDPQLGNALMRWQNQENDSAWREKHPEEAKRD